MTFDTDPHEAPSDDPMDYLTQEGHDGLVDSFEGYGDLDEERRELVQRAFLLGVNLNHAEQELVTDTIEAVNQQRFDFGMKSTIASCLIGLGKTELRINLDAVRSMWDAYDLEMKMSEDGTAILYKLSAKEQQG